MSFQDILETAFSSLQYNNIDQAEFGNLRGAIHQVFNSGNRIWSPLIDMVDIAEFLYIYVEIPGVKTDSIDIEVLNNKIIISGDKIKNIVADSNIIKNEIGYGKFNRTIGLPISVTDKKNVSIAYSNGMLSITIDKKKEESHKFNIKLE